MANVTHYADYAATRPGAGIVARLRKAYEDFRRYEATFDELEALGDRELADLGLYRVDLRAVAREAVYGR